MSSDRKSRRELFSDLETAMQNSSGQGVLYGQAVAERLGINNTDLECLGYMASHGKVTAGALSELTGLTTGAITGVIDRLETAGLVRRERDPSDRRKVMVTTLPAVRERVVPLFKPLQRAVMSMSSGYSDEDLAFLVDFFTRARQASLAAMAELRSMKAPKR